MSFAEAPDGTIFVATYPRAELYRYDPEAGDLEYLTRLDPSEKYPYYLAVDDSGWVYSGLGTVHGTLVAYNPETEVTRMLHESTLRTGEGSTMGAIPRVHRGVDGEVYGEAWPGGQWLRLSNGNVEPVENPAEPIRHRSAKFTKEMPSLPNGGEIKDFTLPSGTFTLVRPDGSTKNVSFDYESLGAGITRLVEGPDGDLYGGTSHPLQFFRYRPEADRLTNLGGIDKVGGGNFPAYAVTDGKIYGTAYLGGHLYEIDPNAEWTGGEGDHPNPTLLESYSRHIGRPRVMQVHDGELIIGGFPGYGDVGGGLAFYDLTTGESTLLTNDKLVRGQSTITLRVLPQGDIVAGTSIAAPGGAEPTAEEAVIYGLDRSSRKVTYSVHSIEGATEIPAVEIGADGRVFGLTGDGLLFTFDPQRRKVARRLDLTEYGSDIGTDQSLRMLDNERLLVILQDGIITVNTETLKVEEATNPPVSISAGTGLLNGDLYFASEENVWRFNRDECS